jgi:carbonic anhydrase
MSTDLTAKVPPPPPPQRMLWLQKTSLRAMMGGSTPFRAPDVRVDGGGVALTGPPHGMPATTAAGALPPPPPAVPVPQPLTGSPAVGGTSSATAPPALALSASSKKRPGMLVSNGSALRIMSAMRRGGTAEGDSGEGDGGPPNKGAAAAARGPVPLLQRTPVLVGLAVGLTALVVGCAVYYAAAPRTVTRTVEVVPDWANFGPDEETLWSYAEKADNGPHAWGEIRNATSGAVLYPACADSGTSKQSPVAIEDGTSGVAVVGGVASLARNYTARGQFQVVPRPGGHPGFQVAPYNDSAEARWVLDGEAYDLVQFHYHSPSEHTLNGVRYPLEVHFVHRAPSTGALAVFGIL